MPTTTSIKISKRLKFEKSEKDGVESLIATIPSITVPELKTEKLYVIAIANKNLGIVPNVIYKCNLISMKSNNGFVVSSATIAEDKYEIFETSDGIEFQFPDQQIKIWHDYRKHADNANEFVRDIYDTIQKKMLVPSVPLNLNSLRSAVSDSYREYRRNLIKVAKAKDSMEKEIKLLKIKYLQETDKEKQDSIEKEINAKEKLLASL